MKFLDKGPMGLETPAPSSNPPPPTPYEVSGSESRAFGLPSRPHLRVGRGVWEEGRDLWSLVLPPQPKTGLQLGFFPFAPFPLFPFSPFS